MAERKFVFRCQNCGYVSAKWMGRCPDCQSWHSMLEESFSRKAGPKASLTASNQQPVSVIDIHFEAEPRLVTSIYEWDRVLGGGLVPGSIVLLAGDPGIGKSTLLLQVLGRFAKQHKVLYVSGEESPQQLKRRAERLAVDSPDLFIYAETLLESIMEAAEKTSPVVLGLDSVQTVHSSLLDSIPGSISQVRDCTSRLMRTAKEKNITVLLVGHVTKEGAIAGPRVLEHLVDTVLYLEGDRTHAFRILRAVKNRFGSSNEIGVFEMKEAGLEEVSNPSQLFLAERPVDVSGSVVACSIEGTRPLLVELQALVSGTGWSQPRRTCMGIDSNRLSLLLAVLEKKLGFDFAQHDVFVNVAGGVRLFEPAADLALTTALMSSYLDRPLPADLVVWGEVGLAGEIRGVGRSNLRVAEAQKLGYTQHLIPKTNAEKLKKELGVDCIGANALSEVMEILFGGA